VTLLSSTTVFAGRVFSVSQDRVLLPHGAEVTLDVVQHRGSVVLLPMATETSVWLVRQYRHTLRRAVWEIPAGTIDPEESAETAAQRECHEEIGRWPDGVTLLASLYPSPGYTTEVMHFYKLTDLREPDEAAVQDADEHLETRVVEVEALGALIAAGDIIDMKTVVGWQLLLEDRRGR
jgi:ADP-ribose pyrophosphatase